MSCSLALAAIQINWLVLSLSFPLNLSGTRLALKCYLFCGQISFAFKAAGRPGGDAPWNYLATARIDFIVIIRGNTHCMQDISAPQRWAQLGACKPNLRFLATLSKATWNQLQNSRIWGSLSNTGNTCILWNAGRMLSLTHKEVQTHTSCRSPDCRVPIGPYC